MNKYNVQALLKWLDARHVRERAILLVAALGLLTMLWLVFVHDVMTAAKQAEARGITVADSRILEQQNRQNEIRNSYSSDPNAFALTRQRELREATASANERLNRLYGELISPQRMSQVLTSILQRETRLNLVSLENRPSQALLTAAANATSPNAAPVQVFKHGMHMVFEGNFIETVYYLRSLESLDGNFFWENLEFQVTDYPNARISLDIYTLSTEQGWIGV